MSCDRSAARYYAAICTPDAATTATLGGHPQAACQVLDELRGIAEVRAAGALAGPALGAPRRRVDQLQARAEAARAEEDCRRLFHAIHARGLPPPAHGDPLPDAPFPLPRPAAMHAYAEVQRALDAASLGQQTPLVQEVLAGRAARVERQARAAAARRAWKRARSPKEHLLAWADEHAAIDTFDRRIVRVVYDGGGSDARAIYATGFGDDQEWAVYRIRADAAGRPVALELEGFTRVDGPLPAPPRRWPASREPGTWERLAPALDLEMTEGVGALAAADVRQIAGPLERLARALDDLRAADDAHRPAIWRLVDEADEALWAVVRPFAERGADARDALGHIITVRGRTRDRLAERAMQDLPRAPSP